MKLHESRLHQGIVVNFRVYGTPRPGGSKKAFVIPGTNRASVTEDCKKSKDWRADVRHACQQAYSGPLLTGPLFMRIIFWIARPKGHYGSGKNAGVVKNSSPLYPATKPDTTKLIRSTEDALTKILWKDDTQVIMQVAIKKYTTDKPGADILVEEMTPEMEWKCLTV
jgi:Holliday junction resolvase RusA-like endonuclease